MLWYCPSVLTSCRSWRALFYCKTNRPYEGFRLNYCQGAKLRSSSPGGRNGKSERSFFLQFGRIPAQYSRSFQSRSGKLSSANFTASLKGYTAMRRMAPKRLSAIFMSRYLRPGVWGLGISIGLNPIIFSLKNARISSLVFKLQVSGVISINRYCDCFFRLSVFTLSISSATDSTAGWTKT